MIHAKYRDRVEAIDAETQAQVCRMLKLNGPLLQSRRHSQADVVLCLLRINTPQSLAYAQTLVGKPITHCPPCLSWRPVPVLPVPRSPDDRRVLSVVAEPMIRGRRSWLTRYHLFKPGLTVRQLLARGATKGDLKLVLKRKWITLEAA